MADSLFISEVLKGLTGGLVQGMQLRQNRQQQEQDAAFKQQQLGMQQEEFGLQKGKFAADEIYRQKQLDLEYAKLNKEKSEKKADYKEFQLKNATFAQRIESANRAFGTLPAKDTTSLTAAVQRSSLFPEFAKSEKLKLQNQAEQDFINAVLRRDTGAAIAPIEYTNFEKQYFPRAGDSKNVLKAKENARKREFASMTRSSGGAYEYMKSFETTPLVDQNGKEDTKVASSIAPKTKPDVRQNGVIYTWNGKDYIPKQSVAGGKK